MPTAERLPTPHTAAAASPPEPGRRGKDLFTVVGIDLGEAATGCLKLVSLPAQGTCVDCQVRGGGGACMWSQIWTRLAQETMAVALH